MFLFQYAHHLTAAPFLTFTKQSNRIHEAAKMIFSDINLQHEDTDYTGLFFTSNLPQNYLAQQH